jgi:hypothetical protein
MIGTCLGAERAIESARLFAGRLERARRGTVYALKFTADGGRRYLTLGTAADGWSQDRAERELAYVLAQVERGAWRPPQPAGPADDDPTFHVFASA